MKIVKILGGIGNQMFQYALYLSLKQKFPSEKVLLDYSYFKTYHVHNGLELQNVFHVSLPQATFYELLKVTWPVRSFLLSRFIRKFFPSRSTECLEAKDYTYNSNVFGDGNKYYDGYWQNYLYFKDCIDLVYKQFTFQIPLDERNKSLLHELSQSQSVSIHIRRGDYLKAKNYIGLCGLDYYQKAIDYIKSCLPNPVFYIFSNDMNWCRINITPLLGDYSVYYVDWNTGKDSSIDMQLMSNCKHNIIANSSFSWWAAFLNKNAGKIVCAPEKWTNTKVNTKFQMPEWVLF